MNYDINKNTTWNPNSDRVIQMDMIGESPKQETKTGARSLSVPQNIKKDRSTTKILLDTASSAAGSAIKKRAKNFANTKVNTGKTILKVANVPVDLVGAGKAKVLKSLMDNAKTQGEKDNIQKSLDDLYASKNKVDSMLKLNLGDKTNSQPQANTQPSIGGKGLDKASTQKVEAQNASIGKQSSTGTASITPSNTVIQNQQKQTSPASSTTSGTNTSSVGKTSPQANQNNSGGPVGLLTSKGLSNEDVTKQNRAKLAAALGIVGSGSEYQGTKEQNLKLMELTKGKSGDEIKKMIYGEPTTPTPYVESSTEVEIPTSTLSDKMSWEEEADTATEKEMTEEDKRTAAEKALDESKDKYIKNVEDTNEKNKETLKKEGEETSAANIESNFEARQRADDSFEKLKKIGDEFRADTEARRQEINDNLGRQQQAANRNANITAAVFGQSGRGLPAGAMSSLVNDVLGSYSKNITEAEMSAIQNNQVLDQALRDTNMNLFAKDQDVKTFLNSLDTEEDAPIIAALGKMAQGDVTAANDVKTFLNEYEKKIADEDINRVSRDKRIEVTEQIWQEADSTKKLALLSERLYEVPGANFIIDSLPKLITRYPNMSLVELENIAKNIIAYEEDKNIKGNNASALPKEQRSQAEKDYVNNLYTSGAERQNIVGKRTQEEIIADTEKMKQMDEAKKVETQTEVKKAQYGGFKTQSQYDTFLKMQKEMADRTAKVRASVEEQRGKISDTELKKKVAQFKDAVAKANAQLEKYKQQNKA